MGKNKTLFLHMNIDRIAFIVYFIIIIIILIIISKNTLIEAFSGKGYIYVYSLENPAFIFTLSSIPLHVFKVPLVAEMVLYYFVLTVISSITIYFMLLRFMEEIEPKVDTKAKYVAISLGSFIYVFYPRILITDVGPSFLMLKAILPLLAVFTLNASKSKTKLPLKPILAYSSLLALAYTITYDPRIILHSIIITLVLYICFSHALNIKLKDNIYRALLFTFMVLVLALLFSFPRVYGDIFIRTMPFGAGIAFVRGAFLYTWSSYLTSFMGLPAFLYPFYKYKLGPFIGLLVIPAFTLGLSLLISFFAEDKRSNRGVVRFLLMNTLFYIAFLAFFSSSSFPAIPPFVKIVFNDINIWLYYHFPLIKYFFILFRAPRFLSDFLHLFYTMIATIFLVSIYDAVRKRPIKVLAILVFLVITSAWLIPLNGNALIFNVKAIKETKYYDKFLESVHGSISTSLSTMLYHGSRPGGYLIKYIYPVRPYWRADGTIANFVYEFLREKIYTRDLFSAYFIMNLYGFKYIIINTINGLDKAVGILNQSRYFIFVKKIGPFYIFKVKNSYNFSNFIPIHDYIFVAGGLETYARFTKDINSILKNENILFVPVFDDSWNYNFSNVVRNAKAIIVMNRKDLLDLVFSYLVLEKKYGILIVPSRYSYDFDPLHKWSPAFPTYAFHGVFPYFDWFPAPYTWEYGYDPRYGFIWTKALNADITIKFHVSKSGKYILLVKHLVTPMQQAKILIKVDDKKYILSTQDNRTKYSYLKVSSLGPIFLKEGPHKIKITNLQGLNMLNLLIIISQESLKKAFNHVRSILENKTITYIPLGEKRTNTIMLSTLVHKLMSSNRNIVECNVKGVFYREYKCRINNENVSIENGKILVFPELYGLLKPSTKNVVSIPVMYVLQGYGYIGCGNSIVISNIRRQTIVYEWISFFISIMILFATLAVGRRNSK